MRVITVGFALLSTVLAGQALAADKKAAVEKKERMVCKSQMLINSRFEKRVCKSAREWEKLADRHSDAWREQLARPVVPPDLRP